MLGGTFKIMTRGTGIAARRTSAISRHMMSTAAASQADQKASVLFESKGSLRTYILNRDSKLNALNTEMLDLLRLKLEEWSKSELCGIIVGRANGRAFCAGGDVAGVVANAANPAKRHLAVDFFKQEFEVDYMLAALPKPYVAIIDKITMGGGAGLSAMAPFRVATEKTLFAMPETKIGYSPDVGANYFLNQLDGEVGTYLALTGNTLSGRAVYEHGLATHYIPSRRIPTLLESLAALEDPSLPMINSTIDQFYCEPDAGEPSTSLKGAVRIALDAAFGHQSVEKIITSLQSYSSSADLAVSTWAKETLETLHLRSPTSLRIALHAFRRSKNAEYVDALRTELGIATALCNGASPDFATGVTAVLVKKTPGRPAWSPSTISDVSEDSILTNYFSPASPYFDPKPEITIPEYLAKPKNPMRFSLPTQEEVRHYIMQDTPFSGGLAVSQDQVLRYFEEKTHGKGGVKEKVSDVLDRKCELEKGADAQNPWLRWKH